MNLPTQFTIGRYQLTRLLGEGGMGAVFKATDVKLKREVALKIMRPSLAVNPQFRDRFLQEAQSGARLKHPGIVPVHDIGEDGKYLYIVMDFIAGENLEKRLKTLQAENKTMPLEESLELVRQVSLALAYAHQQGVLHRDIKPANILLEPVEGEVLPYRPVLSDLGLAKLLVGGLETLSGLTMGTPAYSAPEQALGRTVDARSDVYGMGVLLYELVSGKLPFSFKTVSDLVRFHTAEPPLAPPPLPPECPPTLANLLLQALQRVPDKRPASAAAFAESLGRILEEQRSGRAPSVLKKIKEASEQETKDHLEIFSPEGELHTVSLEGKPLIIGRVEGNDIVLDDANISRQHARIEFDGMFYRVTDLDSTNGTFLGKTHLRPGISTVWQAEQPLHIGNHYIHLIQGESAPPDEEKRQESTLVDMKLVIPSTGEGHMGVLATQTNLSVVPGFAEVLSFKVVNRSDQVDHVQVRVEGLFPGWVGALPQPVRLKPGETQELKLSLQPPRLPESRVTRYPFILRLTSQTWPEEVSEIRYSLSILPFDVFACQVQPQTLKAGELGQVTVENHGNLPETYSVCWIDSSGMLEFKPPEAQLRIQAGMSGTVEFYANPVQGQLFEGEKTYPFQVQVKAVRGEEQSLEGQVRGKRRVAPWLWFLMVLVWATTCVLLGLILKQLFF
jgi:eukaryotic-like serine/threonine-protein kinase